MLVTRSYLIANLSHGGMGVSLPRGAELPRGLQVGSSCGLEVRLHAGAARPAAACGLNGTL
jgi:hypothetical protein